MKRQRGRGRRPGGGGHHNHGGGGGGGGGHQNPNRTLESNGPETKVRGPAAVIFERYLQLARDAASSGDRVLSENYLQHADHYFRLVRSMQPAVPVQPPAGDRFGDNAEGEGDDDGVQDAEGAEEGEASAESDQPDVDFPEGQQQQAERGGDGEFRRGRNRGRRNRFREGEGGEGQRAEGGERPPREDRAPREGEGQRAEGGEPRRERRPPREPREGGDNESQGREGFSSGPKPAFLRSGE